MKGGGLPSLSSGDRLPGPAPATPGLCYVPHKSGSCFTDALPRRGAALICHAELPGKFFCCVIDTAAACLLLLLLSFLRRAPPMLNSYRASAASVIVSAEALTSTRPRQNVASPSKNAHPASAVDRKGGAYAAGSALPHPTPHTHPSFPQWHRTLTGTWKPRRELGHRGLGARGTEGSWGVERSSETHAENPLVLQTLTCSASFKVPKI